ncbi:modification methylase, HemK family [Hymenobacter roseosalivarius DSM 11622]|uniref:peptide chain release factor N(5)-glutamine methyltransferase n=1 Tax=Hymenobacter roseosalivarius DSM 11622 TaxID=645990 RepID=A0A1W1UKP4_9BACT|nr:peptide chain release factor N(5)-glutamine methyltransferase [Hymenobacter roseosalivarius]SMB81630.1 modification methylase, HemK family [Hymenobacter roseosalivarius DSM 11622]
MTILELTRCLSTALGGIYPEPEAAAIAGQVLEYYLKLTPLIRRMQAAELVSMEKEQLIEAAQDRLLRHEPLQYVLGTAYFAGLELAVTPATLIPRPETEELVALISKEQKNAPQLTILDIGTGSGCIPIALSQALPEAWVMGVDISAEALAVARRNAARYAPNVEFQEVDILRAAPTGIAPHSLAVLVSNPPYVLESERVLMRPNVLRYEPATALFVPDNDPLLFYRRIAGLGQELLRPGGKLYFEINERYAESVLALLAGLGYAGGQIQQDMFGKDRMVSGVFCE